MSLILLDSGTTAVTRLKYSFLAGALQKAGTRTVSLQSSLVYGSPRLVTTALYSYLVASGTTPSFDTMQWVTLEGQVSVTWVNIDGTDYTVIRVPR